MGSFRNGPLQYIICSGFHTVEEHCCGIAGCNKGKGKICANVTVQCANYRGGHSAKSNQCNQRQKAKMHACKNKILSKSNTKMFEPNNTQDKMPNKSSSSPDKITPSPGMGIDLAPEWVEYKEEKGSDHNEIPKRINHY